MSGLVSHVDPIENIFTIFDGIFRTVVPNQSARHYFGLKAISWKLAGYPGWYLWFEGKPGAYLVEVIGGSFDTEPGWKSALSLCGPSEDRSPQVDAQASMPTGDYSPVSRAMLRIKYFPDPADPTDCFDDFSVHEQVARLSGAFDNSGAPSFEGIESLDEGFFWVGSIACAVTAGRDYLEAVLTAPDRWITRHSKGLFATGKNGESIQVVAPGLPDRNVPAWELAWFAFEKFISCLCYAREISPRSVALYRTAGKFYESDEKGQFSERCDSLSGGYSIHLSFKIDGAGLREIDGTGRHFVNCLPDPPDDGLNSVLLYSGKEPPDDIPWVKRQWWHSPDCRLWNHAVEGC